MTDREHGRNEDRTDSPLPQPRNSKRSWFWRVVLLYSLLLRRQRWGMAQLFVLAALAHHVVVLLLLSGLL